MLTDIEDGDTVYALKVLGRSACSEAPSMLFAMRGDELEVLNIELPTKWDMRTWYECRLKRGSGSFFVTARDITKMKHFESNYNDFDRSWDEDKARHYRGW